MPSPQVLLIDDEEDFLQAVSLGLQGRGFDVATSPSAEDALEKLKAITPKVIIADLRMQPMNGFDFYQKLKKDPKYDTVKFFFLTGMKDSLAEKYGLTLGAEAYLLKPVDLDELEKAIVRALGS
jgi:DNA-binding response OmpR family regulator